MSIKLIIIILISTIFINYLNAFSIRDKFNDKSVQNNLNQKSNNHKNNDQLIDNSNNQILNNLINSETIQQVLLKKRSTRSTVNKSFKSKLINSLKSNSLIEYEVENECKLKSMYLRIDELGWKNKVLAPYGFEFNYCDGNCKPIEYTPLPLIVREENSTKLKIYENLLITKCG